MLVQPQNNIFYYKMTDKNVRNLQAMLNRRHAAGKNRNINSITKSGESPPYLVGKGDNYTKHTKAEVTKLLALPKRSRSPKKRSPRKGKVCAKYTRRTCKTYKKRSK